MNQDPVGAPPNRFGIESALADLDANALYALPHVSRYLLADALLRVETDSAAFHAGFLRNYGECAVPALERTPHIVFQVRALGDGAVLATFRGAEAGPIDGFPGMFLPPSHGVRLASRAEWTLADLDHPVGPIAYSRDGIVAASDSPWEALFASVAVNRVLSVQPQIVFFHGAAVRVNGRGLLLLGVSGAGKTSVSLALAARGHDFYGDDIVGVRLDSRSIVPLRRAAHVRTGPTAPEVARALGDAPASHSGQRLTEVSRLFPQAGAAPATLDLTVCLRHFTGETCLTAFSPRPEDLRWVTPHVGSLHAGRPAERAMRVVSLFSDSACFFLDSASPESAANALEQLTE